MLPPPGLEASIYNVTPTTAAFFAAATIASSATMDLISAVSSTAVLAATASAAATKPDQPKEDNGKCELLGPFAILVQGSLGFFALLSLVFKRWRERPQRPIKVWSFDVSKQVVGSVLVHVANLVMSLLSSGELSVTAAPDIVARALTLDGLFGLARRAVETQEKYKPNPCSFYLLNLAIDTTIGIPILIVLLRLLTALFSLTPLGNPPESIMSGHYGSPPKATWWFKQSIIYFIGLMGMKICVLIIFLLAPWISRVGDWALRWTEGDEALQVIFVMLVFPVIMNATQYYIIDSFIQNQNKGQHEQIPSEDPDETFDAARDAVPYAESLSGGSDADDEHDPEVLAKSKMRKDRPQSSSSRNKQKLQVGRKDYDPSVDGETESSSTLVVGSSSTTKGIDTDEELSK